MSRWLKADYSINCDSGLHGFFEFIAAMMALVDPLGIPCMYAFLLYRARKDLILGKGQAKLLNIEVVKYKIVSNDSDKSSDGYVVGSQNEMSEAMTKLDTEIVTLDEDGAMKCSLFMREQNEKKNRKIKRLNFLYGNYEPSCWWFVIFETCRRLLLTAGVSFLNPGTASQIMFSIICGLGSMRIYSGYKPFIEPGLDRLAEAM